MPDIPMHVLEALGGRSANWRMARANPWQRNSVSCALANARAISVIASAQSSSDLVRLDNALPISSAMPALDCPNASNSSCTVNSIWHPPEAILGKSGFRTVTIIGVTAF
jgi:hypothetical protein